MEQLPTRNYLVRFVDGEHAMREARDGQEACREAAREWGIAAEKYALHGLDGVWVRALAA